MAHESPEFRLFTPESPIYTRPRYLPPTHLGHVEVENSLIANGCQIGKGSHIENSVIGLRTVIGDNVHVRNSIVMGADYYESGLPQTEANAPTPLGIGHNSVIDGAIIDKNCRIGSEVSISNLNQTVETDLNHPTCVIRDSIPIITKGGELKQGWKLSEFLKSPT